MSEPEGNEELIRAKAQMLNLDVKYPAPNELFLDVDSAEDFKHFISLFDRLQVHLPDVTFTWTKSKSGGDKKHVIVTFPSELGFSEIERIAWQACMGSDRIREFLSMLSWKKDATSRPTVFFEQKKTKIPGPTTPYDKGGYF